LAQKGPGDVYFVPIFDDKLDWPTVAADISKALYIPEGPLKGIRIAQAGYIALCGNGISGLGGKRKGFKKSLDQIKWTGRRVVIVPDADWEKNPEVRAAVMRLADELVRRGALVFVKLLQPLEGKPKAGADDVLSTEGGDDLFRKTQELTSADPVFESWRVRPEVAELNKTYAAVQLGNKFRIAVEPDDPDDLHTFIERRTFIELLENKFVEYEVDGEFGRSPLSALWLQSEHRRQYQRVAFLPGAASRPDTLNLWRGWTVAPKKGDWSLLKDHILKVIAGGNPEHYKWIINWMAYRVQHLNEPIEVTLVLFSEEEGAGKGIFLEQFGRIFGVHFVTVTGADEVFGKFNVRMETALLVFADEAFFAGNPEHMSRLMAFITARRQAIERKNIDSYEVRNFRGWCISTNHLHVLQASRTARRWAVFDVSAAKIGDAKYFRSIRRQMDKGGAAAMLHDLLAMKCHRPKAPNTKGLERQKLLSLKPCERFIRSLLVSGLRFDGKEWGDKEFTIPRDALAGMCRDFLERERAPSYEYKSLTMHLSAALHIVFDKALGTGWFRDSEGKNFRAHVLPQLSRARELFKRKWSLGDGD
jgi:hypothetical protein